MKFELPVKNLSGTHRVVSGPGPWPERVVLPASVDDHAARGDGRPSGGRRVHVPGQSSSGGERVGMAVCRSPETWCVVSGQ